MRESFIFHFEYLEDIPVELQSEYAMYVINYARYGEEPALDDWRDKRMWNRTKARMDQETENYNKKCRNLKNNQEAEPKNQRLQISIEPEIQDHQVDAVIYQAYTNESEPEEKPKKKRFVKPTVEEIQAYCQERGNKISAQHFFDFYESKGWKVGSSGMKDWKAAVRNWESRQQTPAAAQPQRQLPEDRLIF